MSSPIIQLENLEKRYGPIQALAGLTLELPPGAVGLLGPNGAGKTTLLKLLLGQLAPSAGRAVIAGMDPSRRSQRFELRRRVGYMPEGDCLIPGMNAVELVTTLGRVTGLSRRDAMTRAHEVLDYVGLDESRYRSSDEYSTGMKQRLKLAQALVHDPDLLLLDEPTNGLDPKGRRHMLDVVSDLARNQGKNVLFCSHILPDVERTCREIVVLHRGRVLETGNIASMTSEDERWVRVKLTAAAPDFFQALESAAYELEQEDARTVRVKLSGEDSDELFALAQRSGAVVQALAPMRSSLEEVFLGALSEAG